MDILLRSKLKLSIQEIGVCPSPSDVHFLLIVYGLVNENKVYKCMTRRRKHAGIELGKAQLQLGQIRLVIRKIELPWLMVNYQSGPELGHYRTVWKINP